MKEARLGYPNLGMGVGLRGQHFPYLLQDNDPLVDWFEIISENYMDNYGYARYALQKIAEKRPVVMHGVSMNVGSTDPLNVEYLNKLKQLADEINTVWVSDHLCWTGMAHANTHDLLPMPLTEESLAHTIQRVNQVQEVLERPLIIENPSTYMEYEVNTFTEWEFLTELVRGTNCGLLLDVNNVFVSSFNHGYEPETYLNNLPHESIVQMHIAGPTHCGQYMIDTHDQPVPDKVWDLYRLAYELTGGVSTLLEWDANIPEYPELVEELFKAKRILNGEHIEQEVMVTESAVSNPVGFHMTVGHE